MGRWPTLFAGPYNNGNNARKPTARSWSHANQNTIQEEAEIMTLVEEKVVEDGAKRIAGMIGEQTRTDEEMMIVGETIDMEVMERQSKPAGIPAQTTRPWFPFFLKL